MELARDLGFVVVTALVVLTVLTYWVRWVGLFDVPPSLMTNLRHLGPVLPLLVFWGAFLYVRHASMSSLWPIAIGCFLIFILLLTAFLLYLRGPVGKSLGVSAVSSTSGVRAKSGRGPSLLLTRQFLRLTSRVSWCADDDLPDAMHLESAIGSRANLELNLMIRWAGMAIIAGAGMVVVSFVLHQISKTAEHGAFYVFVAVIAFCITGMSLHCLRYVIAQLATYRQDIRQRAGRTNALANMSETAVSFWFTTPRDSDF